MSRAKSLACVAIIILAGSLIPAIYNLVTDPFQVFHKSYIPTMGLHHNQRFQNAGLINSFLADPGEGYDSVMIGTSLSENFTTQIAANALGWKKPLRLFLGGGDPLEQSLTLKHALNTRRVKHVLWEISPSYYAMDEIWLRGSQGSPHSASAVDKQPFPAYLYNESRIDDLHYIFNIDILKLSRQYKRNHEYLFPFTTDTLGYWADRSGETHRQFNSAENIKALSTQQQFSIAEYKKTVDANTFEYPALANHVFPILQAACNSDVEFVLFIPPLSKIKYRTNPADSYRAITMARYILKATESCVNIRVHAFDTMKFTEDMNNYKDSLHYGLPISNKLLELIGKHQNIITLQNIDAYENDFIRNVDNYRVYSSYPHEPAI